MTFSGWFQVPTWQARRQVEQTATSSTKHRPCTHPPFASRNRGPTAAPRPPAFRPAAASLPCSLPSRPRTNPCYLRFFASSFFLEPPLRLIPWPGQARTRLGRFQRRRWGRWRWSWAWPRLRRRRAAAWRSRRPSPHPGRSSKWPAWGFYCRSPCSCSRSSSATSCAATASTTSPRPAPRF